MASTKTFDVQGALVTNVGSILTQGSEVSFGYGTQTSAYGISLGYSARASTFTGSTGDIVIGHTAGKQTSFTVGASTNNIFIGTDCVSVADGASSNVVIGHDAGDTLTVGTSNVAIGNNAGTVTTSGGDNIAIGSGAGTTLGASVRTVAIGKDAEAGDESVAIGYKAFARGTSCVAIGNTINSGVLILDNSCVIGSDMNPRMDNETAVAGMRIIRKAPIPADYSAGTPLIVFPVVTAHEIVHVDVTVTSYDSTSNIKWTMFSARDYMFYNNGTATLLIGTGSQVSYDPGVSGDTITLTASGTNVLVTYTAGNTNLRTVVGVMRVYAGRLL
jgi:hypothetical protein